MDNKKEMNHKILENSQNTKTIHPKNTKKVLLRNEWRSRQFGYSITAKRARI